MIISLKRLWNNSETVSAFYFRFVSRVKRVWNETEIKLFYFSFILHVIVALDTGVWDREPNDPVIINFRSKVALVR